MIETGGFGVYKLLLIIIIMQNVGRGDRASRLVGMPSRGGSSGGPSSLSWSLLAFAVVPPLVYLASEVDKSIRIGTLRGVEVADVVVAFPVWVAMICNVHWRVLLSGSGADADADAGAPRRGRGLFLGAGVLLLCVFAYGHAMHWTANAVNTYITEYNLEKNLRARVDDEVYELVYWLDEHLGHAIFFTTLHAFVAAWTLASAFWTTASAAAAAVDAKSEEQDSATTGTARDHQDGSQGNATFEWLRRLVRLLLPVAAGGACGVVHSVAFIEGSSLELGRTLAGAHLAVVLGVLIAPAVLLAPPRVPHLVPGSSASTSSSSPLANGSSSSSNIRGNNNGSSRRRRRHFFFFFSALDLLAGSEVVRFTATLGATVLGATAAYEWLFPGGETPSELGGWWCVAVPSRFEYCTAHAAGAASGGAAAQTRP